MMRRVVALVALASAMVMMPSVAEARFQVVCFLSHRLHDDPIVFPGQPDLSHLHDFFANITTNAFSTYQDMVAGGTNCRLSDDTAGYWTPSLLMNGVPVGITRINVYYQEGTGITPASVQPFPADFRMIAGGDTTKTKPQVVSYSCGGGTPRTTVPGNCGTKPVRAHIHFPNCWVGGGVTDSVDHRSHMAVSKSAGCPASHPVPLPKLVFQIVYATTNATGATLSSGAATTLHADFWNTWNQPALDALVATCINPGGDCGELIS